MTDRIVTEEEIHQDILKEFWECIYNISKRYDERRVNTDGFFKFEPLAMKKPKRYIIVFAGKAYPVDGFKIITSPQIPVEDFLLDNFDKEAVKIIHYVVSRGREILINGVHNRIEKRKSGRLVFYYDDTEAEARNVSLDVERWLLASL